MTTQADEAARRIMDAFVAMDGVGLYDPEHIHCEDIRLVARAWTALRAASPDTAEVDALSNELVARWIAVQHTTAVDTTTLKARIAAALLAHTAALELENAAHRNTIAKLVAGREACESKAADAKHSEWAAKETLKECMADCFRIGGELEAAESNVAARTQERDEARAISATRKTYIEQLEQQLSAAWHARENRLPERVRIKYEERFTEDSAMISIMVRAAILAYLDSVREPTEEMVNAGADAISSDADNDLCGDMWRAMLDVLRKSVAG